MLRTTAGLTPRGLRSALDMAGASVGIASIGVLDANIPGDLDATALYLGLVAFIAWRTLAAIGIVSAIAAALTSISVDLAANPTNFTSVAIWNGGAGLAIFLGVALLVHRLRVERDALRMAATYDALTGLPNRTLLHDRLEQALLAAAREKFSVGVLVFDLNGFKRVNDTMGHHAGDELLRSIASRVRDAIRASDTCARLAGDEFAVLLPRTTGGGAERVAIVVGRACAQPFVIGDVSLTVGASIGTAVFPDDGDAGEALFRVADARMYEAKGRARTAAGSDEPLVDLAAR